MLSSCAMHSSGSTAPVLGGHQPGLSPPSWAGGLTQARERMYAPVVGCRRTLLSASCACCKGRGGSKERVVGRLKLEGAG